MRECKRIGTCDIFINKQDVVEKDYLPDNNSIQHARQPIYSPSFKVRTWKI